MPELGREKEIIVLENTKPILADKICYWRDPEFAARVTTAPAVPAMNLAHFSAVTERRLRDLQPDEIDLDGTGQVHMPPEYLEVLQAWDPRDLPPNLADISEDDAVAYVERHFMLLGVPARRIVQARRHLSTNDLDVAELDFVEPARLAARHTSQAGSQATGALQ